MDQQKFIGCFRHFDNWNCNVSLDTLENQEKWIKENKHDLSIVIPINNDYPKHLKQIYTKYKIHSMMNINFKK